jgi:peroxiredoxin
MAAQISGAGEGRAGDDVNETPSAGLAFIRQYGITYPSINDPGYAVVQQISQVAPIASQPTTLVIDKTGHVAGMVLGTVSFGDLATLLHQAEAAHA